MQKVDQGAADKQRFHPGSQGDFHAHHSRVHLRRDPPDGCARRRAPRRISTPSPSLAFIVSFICAIVWLIIFAMRTEATGNDNLMLPGLLGFVCLLLLGMHVHVLPQGGGPVGPRDRAAAGQVPRRAPGRAVLADALRRHRGQVDRYPRADHGPDRGGDADQGHRAGRRGRRDVLAGLRPEEGRAGSGELRQRRDLGRPDRAARPDRQDDARRPAGRPRRAGQAAAGDHRHAHRALGRQRAKRRDPRDQDPQRAAGHDVAARPRPSASARRA